jgi:hypothetical protein
MIDLVDLSASLAALTGQKADPVTMPDSLNVLPALLGRSKTGRDHVVEYANRLDHSARLRIQLLWSARRSHSLNHSASHHGM